MQLKEARNLVEKTKRRETRKRMVVPTQVPMITTMFFLTKSRKIPNNSSYVIIRIS
jgi:hypothetical protein